MDQDSFRKVNQIIERESKTASYKFALIRATIEILQNQQQHVPFTPEGYVAVPMVWLVERWLVYYYP